jgi:aminomethyltransferase
MKRTRLYEIHNKSGAKIIEFFGWEMPVEYKGVIDEHIAVRTRAGLFDVSHMGEVMIEGPDALAFVQHLTPNDAARLAPGQVQYTALTTPAGTFMDDMLVYCHGPEKYFLVVNAANADKDYAWIVDHKKAFAVETENQSDAYSQLALQGPMSRTVLQPLTEMDLTGMKSFHFAFGKVAGIDALVSRTGYTGEAILEEGRPHDVLPIGLGARDTLRLEAKLMLYGNDISDKTTVLEADLKWICKFQKGGFLGKAVLEKQLAEGLTRKIAGFELLDKGVPRPHYPVFVDGRKVSDVCSGTFAPFLRKSIGLAYLPIGATAMGTEIEIGIRDKKARAKVIQTPFYKREKN